MKLHLPKKFQAALMATFAAVSFTSVGTASLGAAVFAFAGYQAAAEETATATENTAADEEAQEEIQDNASVSQEDQEEDKRDTTVDPLDWDVMARRAKDLERPGDAALGQLAKATYDAIESEVATPTPAAPEQQQTSVGSGELPSDDLGFTTSPYASSTGNSGPVFEVTPAAAATTDFLQETSTEEESSGSSTGTTTPASASGFGSSADGGYSGGGYSPFGLALASIAPFSVGGTSSLESAPLLGANGTNLVWEGDGESKGTWQNDGEDATSPWRFTPEAADPVAKAFHNGDIAKFEKSAEVTVQGSVQTSSLQIAEGDSTNQIVVTIITPENTTLTANHVVSLGLFEEGAPYTNKIVKQGAGAVEFNVDDPNFKTQLKIEEGDATINFNQISSGQNYLLYTRLDAGADANVTVNVNDAGEVDTVVFQRQSLLRGIEEYNVEEGLTLEINSQYGSDTGFHLDKEKTTINLGSKSTLNSLASTEEVKAKSLTINGTGEDKSEAYFHNMFLYHGAERAVHNLKGNVDVTITTLTIDQNSPDTTMQIDDASSLYVKTMNVGFNNSNESFLHAFKNGGTETERQKVTIDTLNTNSGKTIHLGAAASSEQGASSDYQEAGTVKVGYIQGAGTVVLENNVEVKHTGQSLAEVFDIETANTGDHAFSGTLRLAAANNGTETQHKKAVALFRSAYTAYNAELELQADADFTDYVFVLNHQYGFSGNGIQDVAGHEVKSNSSAMIYSGTISNDKNAEVVIDGQRRTLQLYAASGKNYESSFGMSSGIDIDFSGQGSQTFKGDFDDFKGNVTVGGTRVLGSTLRFIEQETALNIEDLMLRPNATLDVKETENKNQLIKVSGTLTAQKEVSYEDEQHVEHTLEGDSAVVNGDLKMVAGSTYDVSDFQGSGGLNLNGSLTFDPGARLSQGDMDLINEMAIGAKYDLAFNVTSFDGKTESIDWNSPGAIDASTIFTGQFWEGEYYICYSGLNQSGGNGNNVGTVYLYHALPEPTTGTLSLLALAALAARRRRK